MQKWISALPGMLLAAAVAGPGSRWTSTAPTPRNWPTSLDGVGQSKAELIVKYRDMHGAVQTRR